MRIRVLISFCLIFGVFTQIPPSPFGLPENICTKNNGQIYRVNGLPSSPYFITPFSDLFVNPGVAVPKDKVCRNDKGDSHCLFTYQMNVSQTTGRPFDNAIPTCKNFEPTHYLTYNGKIPTERIIVPQGAQTLVRLNNKIENKFFPPEALCTKVGKGGRPHNLHLHGSQSLAPFDGWAEDVACANETKDYVYPNQQPQTLWFHDHSLELTADNVYPGNPGMYIISGKVNDGGCGQPYNLENIEEKIMILGDKVIDNKCQFFFDKGKQHAIRLVGDINTVNGVPFPLMPVDPKWYRFRILNASPVRTYKLLIKDSNLDTVSDVICQIFATDSGFKTQSVKFSKNGLLVGVSERYEFACDFSAYKGQTLYIWNDRFANLPYFCYSHLIAKIEVSSNDASDAPKFDVNQKPDPNKLMQQLILSPKEFSDAKLLANQGTFHRLMEFAITSKGLTINGQNWNSFRIAAQNIGINTWEIWKFKTSFQVQHPIHVHLVDFFVLRRHNGSGIDITQQYEMYSGKDVIFTPPSMEVYLLVRFGAHKGDYMFHCHNLLHQDLLMMRAFRIIDSKFITHKQQISPRFIFNTFLNIVYGNSQYTDPLTNQLLSKNTSTVQSLDVTAKKVLNANFYSVFYPTTQQKKIKSQYANPWLANICYSQ